MTDRALPNWPRLMSADMAPEYVGGISKNNFIAGVERGEWSKPVKYGTRILWDRLDLDADVDRLKGVTAPSDDFDKELDGWEP